MEKFKETKFYKMWIDTIINVAFSFVGNTAGIWFGFLLIEFVFFGVWEDLEWPGISQLIKEGVLLLISFSFLTNAIYYSTRRLKINFFMVFSIIFLFAVALFYARVIAIDHVPNQKQDNILHNVSLACFWGSLILYYLILVYEKFIHLGGNIRGNRDDAFDKLKREFQP